MNDYITYLTPPPAPAPQPLKPLDLRGEWRIAREAIRVHLNAPQLLRAPRGRGQPVMLSPGLYAPEASMSPLKQLLRLKGYQPAHWGQGTNRGSVARYVEALLPRVTAMAERAEQPVALVGWSLGGVISREVAREIPDRVSNVVTFGSPVFGGPAFTATSGSYSPEERIRIREMIDKRNRNKPISVPIAVIFSKLDTVVSWPACIDRINPRVTHYEVTSTHLSMGIDPTVWRIVLERLADPGGR